MKYTTLEVSQKEDIATITLNRPDVHNAMNEQFIQELTRCVHDLGKDDTIHIIMLTGNGSTFCSGADLNWMKSMVTYSKEKNIKDSNLLLDLYNTLYYCPKPIIGKITGHAFGGGVGLVAVCDIAIGVPGLKFAFSETKLGIIPAVISTFVAQRLSQADMRRLFITGERFDSEYAQKIGLLDCVVPLEELETKIQFYVDQLRSSGPQSIIEVKQLLQKMRTMPIEKYKQFTVEKIAELRASKEGHEGISAFLEKRQPKWRK